MNLPVARRADDPPIPPDLMVDQAPLEEELLDRIAGAAQELANEAGIDLTAAARHLAEDMRLLDEGAAADLPLPRWRIEDDGQAEWAMAHVAEAEEQLAQLALKRDVWVERIMAWFGTAAAPLDTRKAFFVSHLEDYALRRREADPKAKTLALPSGKVRTRETPERVVVEDTEAFVAWAEHVDKQLLRVKVEPVAAEVRERLEVRRTVVGEQLELTLECGHSIVFEFVDSPGPEGEKPDPPSHLRCGSCNTAQAVVGQKLLGDITEERVRHAETGKVALGVAIQPPSVSATVAPGA